MNNFTQEDIDIASLSAAQIFNGYQDHSSRKTISSFQDYLPHLKRWLKTAPDIPDKFILDENHTEQENENGPEQENENGPEQESENDPEESRNDFYLLSFAYYLARQLSNQLSKAHREIESFTEQEFSESLESLIVSNKTYSPFRTWLHQTELPDFIQVLVFDEKNEHLDQNNNGWSTFFDLVRSFSNVEKRKRRQRKKNKTNPILIEDQAENEDDKDDNVENDDVETDHKENNKRKDSQYWKTKYDKAAVKLDKLQLVVDYLLKQLHNNLEED